MTDSRGGSALLKTLLASDLVDSTKLLDRLGDERAAELFRRHDRVARHLVVEYEAQEIDKTDGFLLLFERPTNAVRYALAYHERLATLCEEMGVEVRARVGIHIGEVILRENDPADVARGAKAVEAEGLAKPMVARIMSVAGGRQTLMTRGAFDVARRGTLGTDAAQETLQWLAHGMYVLKGVDEAVEIHEVGREGFAPLTAPAETEKVRRAADADSILGWRPAPGIEMPSRPNWIIQEKAGAGGFGEVWRAEHKKTHDRRVYKFCYDSRKLRALKREVTLVRLLKEQLGDRKDIARIIDWNFDDVPYFIESEWTAGGSLDNWVESKGGASAIPLPTRIEIVAQVAEALAAAHSVGVLHKDIKSANILMTDDAHGPPRAQLTDFGIGLLTDRDRLVAADITAAGFTDLGDPTELSSSGSGTRLYMAPELTEGKAATVQADVYALGVVLFQLVVGDLSRALGPGWEREIEDPLLREDIALAVDGNPEQRLEARRLAARLRALEPRLRERQAAARAQERVARGRKRRRWVATVAAGIVLVAIATGVQLRRVALEAQRANREAETANRVLEFLVDLFRLADPSETRGNTVTAREILDEGARRIEAELSDQPEVQARLMATMGSVYVGVGLPNAARPILEASLAIRRRVLGDDAPETAEGLQLLGDLAYSTGDYEAAVRLYGDALAIRSRLPDERHVDVAEALHGLSRSHERLEDWEPATAASQRAIDIYRETGDHPAELATALTDLSNILNLTGDYSGGEQLLREALDLAREAHGTESRQVARILNNLGMTMTAQQRLDEAEQFARDALAMLRELHGNEDTMVGISAVALATLLQMRQDYDEAEVLLREAVAIFSVMNGPENPLTGEAMTILAWVLADKGHHAEAESLTTAALEFLPRTLPPNHWNIAHAQSVLGQTLVARGQDAEAERLLTESYEILKQRGGIWENAALKRIIAFYERRGETAKAAEYRAFLPSPN